MNGTFLHAWGVLILNKTHRKTNSTLFSPPKIGSSKHVELPTDNSDPDSITDVSLITGRVRSLGEAADEPGETTNAVVRRDATMTVGMVHTNAGKHM